MPKDRKAGGHLNQAHYGMRLLQVPRDLWLKNATAEFLALAASGLRPLPIEIWASPAFSVHVYDESRPDGLLRVQVGRTETDSNGDYAEGISWDELQGIKSAIGRADWYGVEVYPRACDVVYLSNVRHLWLLPEPLDIGWELGDDEIANGLRKLKTPQERRKYIDELDRVALSNSKEEIVTDALNP